jgi:ribosomal protein S10
MPLQPIYTTIPSDFIAFVREVNKAFGNQWAPRSAFEEIYQYYLDRTPKEKQRATEMAKVRSKDYMTTYMLDAVEDSAMAFIRSLGDEWQPLIQILKNMTLNERRSFSCKILYQRMKEVQLDELARSVDQPKLFQRETEPLTPEQRKKFEEKEFFDEHLPPNVRDAYLAPRKLHAPYNIIVAQLQIRGYYLPPVDFMADFCVRAAYYFGLPCTGPVPLPRRIERFAVIKSPFAMKKTFENFERRTYSRLVTIKDGHPDIVELWLSYCYRNMYHGTGMKAHIFSNDYVGVGKTMSADVKQLIETDRWSIDGYNQLSDDAVALKSTIDEEIKRIEGQIAVQEDTNRARRVLQQRVDDLLKLEDVATKEAVEAIGNDTGFTDEEISEEAEDAVHEMIDDKISEIMPSLVESKLPSLTVKDLKREVQWDKQQDEALRKHLLHVGMYAQEKGIGPLTREEYFVYVPYVLLPKYKGIHKDVFEPLRERDLLRVPTGNTGYLSNWDNMTERERYEIVLKHRKWKRNSGFFQGDKVDMSRLSRILENRRRKAGILSSGLEMPGEEVPYVPSDEAVEQREEETEVNVGGADESTTEAKHTNLGSSSVESTKEEPEKKE